ncbi:BCL2/adenovirus E1B 19 kDa protein-interacting protein 3-like [Saccoglossus kowalevskii]|uniref:BCL2/adenovirus E1B 19 kDa protein-interacting protein 3-like n=1 Tax=Saccoglossus kowalevskii TaxID=10224 RepID=A0ABM0GR79_SACKO|nr:PREDICTED: BCL2/adenovirus E1B 19 kDa protein-interacting protein 3-like [Saccoglossus kowalevskii]
MANVTKSDQDDTLNESWVELNYGSQNDPSLSQSSGSSHGVPLSIYNGNMEKLLMEAQRESSRSTSRGSSQGGSPKAPNSPIGSSAGSTSGSINGSSLNHQERPQIQLGIAQGLADASSRGEWIWDWSSRPETQPPKEFKFKHPERKSLSMRKSKAMKSGIFSTEFLSVFIPSLILTHLLTLGVGIYIGARLASNKTA